MKKGINMAWKGALVAAAICSAPAHAEEVDFATSPTPGLQSMVRASDAIHLAQS